MLPQNAKSDRQIKIKTLMLNALFSIRLYHDENYCKVPAH